MLGAMPLLPRLRPERASKPRIPLASAALLAIAAALACWGGDEGNTSEETLGESADVDPRLERVLTESTTDPLERTPPIVRVLVSYDSTNYFVDRGQQRGLEYELMRDLEPYLAERSAGPGLPPRVLFFAMRFDDLLPSLLAGRGDVAAAGLTVTEERERSVVFSAPYRTGVREVVVRNLGAEPVSSLEDLDGRSVHVVKGSSYAEHLRALDGVDVVEADPHLRAEDLLQMVNAGIYALTVVDDHVAAVWAPHLLQLVVEETAVHEGGALAWARRPGNDQLGEALDAYARGRRQGTLLGNLLFARYYEDARWVKNPVESSALERLAVLTEAFRASAERNQMDWLSLVAIAFQESGFDPDARSPAGAVGIMQVQPTTALDPNVGVEDVEASVEANIEAGARYLAFLRDRYFSEPEIPLAARFDFTAAAYNAGPARIQRLRRLAAEQGLDPNLWFGHVEHVVRARIGRETFEYVANVNKHYLALRSARAQLEARERALERHGRGG